MKLEDYFDFLAHDDIRIKGHRIGIETILYEYIHRTQTAEEIAQRFSTLSLEQIYATILYYLHNREQVEAYITDWLAWSHQVRVEQAQNPSPAILKLRQVKAERNAIQRNVSEKLMV